MKSEGRSKRMNFARLRESKREAVVARERQSLAHKSVQPFEQGLSGSAGRLVGKERRHRNVLSCHNREHPQHLQRITLLRRERPSGFIRHHVPFLSPEMT